MTDEQIIKAFKCCIDGKCGSCPFIDGCHRNPFEISLAVYDLKLLKAQKAEIERLTEQLNTARADAVREFAERLEEFVREKFDIASGIWIECDDDDEVANAFYFSRTELLNDVSDKIKSIVQEMTEGEQ